MMLSGTPSMEMRTSFDFFTYSRDGIWRGAKFSTFLKLGAAIFKQAQVSKVSCYSVN